MLRTIGDLRESPRWAGKRWPRLLVSSLAVVALGVTAACSGGASTVTTAPTTPAGPSGTAAASGAPGTTAAAKELTGAGATFPYPLYSKWFDVYNQQKSVKINYQAVGSGAGIQQMTARTVDFGASDAPMSDSQLQAAPGILHIPTVAGAVAISYNLQGVDSGLKMSPDVLSGIYLGQITKWNDPKIVALNPGAKLPDQSIAVVHRSDGSGTTNIFTGYLSAVSPDWKSKVGQSTSVNWPVGLGGQGNPGVAGLVKQTPGAIGYVELAYVIQNKLPFFLMQNQAGEFVEPSIASTQAAATAAFAQTPPPADLRISIVNAPGKDSYPIAGFTYMLVYQNQTDPAKGKALVDFLWWATHDGESYAKDLLYVPLTPELTAMDEAKIKSISYQGKPLMQ